MDTIAKTHLRDAVIKALANQEDAAAMQLLGFLVGNEPISQPALPPQRIINGTARGYHYWSKVIRDSFIPFIVDNGRFGFTSIELLEWIENNSNIQMTTGDIETRTDGTPHWRGIVSDALRSLKHQGIIEAEKGSKTYQITNQSKGLLL